MGPPPNMNTTEQMAWEWLMDEIGYPESAIEWQGEREIPDFVCGDEAYEAKRPTAPGKLLVTEKQKRRLDDVDPMVIVVHEDEDAPRDFFRWSERNDNGYVAQTYGGADYIRIECSKESKNEILSLFARIDADADYEDVLLRIADYLGDENRIAEVRQSGSGKYR